MTSLGGRVFFSSSVILWDHTVIYASTAEGNAVMQRDCRVGSAKPQEVCQLSCQLTYMVEPITQSLGLRNVASI